MKEKTYVDNENNCDFRFCQHEKCLSEIKGARVEITYRCVKRERLHIVYVFVSDATGV